MIRCLAYGLFVVLLAEIALAQPKFMQIGGVVTTSKGTPVPGCIVKVVSPDAGPSYPVSTGATGEYYFPEVPSDVKFLYQIQVLWHGTVIFERTVNHPGMQDPIVLPDG